MYLSYARPLLLSALLLGTARCADPVQRPGLANDIPASSSAAAQECAAKLPPAADIIYEDAAPDVHVETNMESLLRVKVLMLIVTAKIKRAEARPAAEQAVQCLFMLQH